MAFSYGGIIRRKIYLFAPPEAPPPESPHTRVHTHGRTKKAPRRTKAPRRKQAPAGKKPSRDIQMHPSCIFYADGAFFWAWRAFIRRGLGGFISVKEDLFRRSRASSGGVISRRQINFPRQKKSTDRRFFFSFRVVIFSV